MNIEQIKERTIVNENGCWIWQKALRAGYGCFKYKGQVVNAHRYIYLLNNSLKPKEVVRHTCHNRACCNPDHLISGTYRDNWNDSKDVHLISINSKKIPVLVNDVVYESKSDLLRSTGISWSSAKKYITDGILDVSAYRAGCNKMKRSPRV